MRRVVDHAQRDGFDRRPRETGRDVGDTRFARLGIDGHGDEGVDQGDGVSARLLCDLRHLRDAGDVGREFYDQRTPRNPLCRGHNLIERPRIAAELQASMGGVWTRDVEFVCGNALAFIENLDGGFVVFARVSEDIGDDHNVFDLL